MSITMKTRQSAKKQPLYSLVIPVYKNESSIKDLCESLATIKPKYRKTLEIIFVVDGSPDSSLSNLLKYKKSCNCFTKILALSKNEGSLTALKAGIDEASGRYIVTKAADLQEPLSLTEDMFDTLKTKKADVVFGMRQSREDPFTSTLFSNLFWTLYRKFVENQIPVGGVDVLGFNEKVHPFIKNMTESNGSLIEYLFWLGFSKQFVPYHRLKRLTGKSAWTTRKKISYVIDSTFSFSNLPISVLFLSGFISFIVAMILACLVITARALGLIQVPGYAATLTISLFFFGLNSVGLSIVGNYVWRIYENTKHRPLYIVKDKYE